MEAAMVVLTRFHILTLAFALMLLISGASFAAQGSRHSRSAVVKNHSVATSRADVSRMPAFAPGGTSRYPNEGARGLAYSCRCTRFRNRRTIYWLSRKRRLRTQGLQPFVHSRKRQEFHKRSGRIRDRPFDPVYRCRLRTCDSERTF